MGWDDQVLDEVSKVVEDGADSSYIEEIIRQITNVRDDLKEQEEKAIRQDYSREELIDICEKAVVPLEYWRNRDTPSAQEGVAQAWGYLKAGIDFEILKNGDLKTDKRVIWVQFYGIPDFSSIEWGAPTGDSYSLIYLPTPERLVEAAGRDWY